MRLGFVDYAIIAVYFAYVIGIGLLLKRRMVKSEDFFLSGRSIPAWITGLAFIAANLGAVEIMGMAANSAEYGLMTAHFYWVGAIPAMVFLGVFMMPFYYSSRIRSVPEYLKYRFNEPTRAFNAISFGITTILISGINMYAMALVLKLLLNWSMTASMLISCAVVLAYTAAGGLTSSIYNEVLQFFLMVFGFLPIAVIGMANAGGWEGLVNSLPAGYGHIWEHTAGTQNPMGVDWLGITFGLGFVLSFGYWCTDFMVIQRAFAARDLNAAQRTPLIAAFPKILFPFIAVIPGMVALSLIPSLGSNHSDMSYNMALPLLMEKYYPAGMLGVGLTAFLASFMSGMAGNITAFNAVWTYDIYQSYIAPGKSDRHYLWMGRIATAGGILVSMGTAYIVMGFPSIMDYIQLLASIFHAPLFATFLLGMFWQRTTATGGFWGLVAGTAAALVHYLLTTFGLLSYDSIMAGNFWRAGIAWIVCFAVTVGLSLVTRPKNLSELKGLVWGLEDRQASEPVIWYKRPGVLAVIALVFTLAFNAVFW